MSLYLRCDWCEKELHVIVFTGQATGRLGLGNRLVVQELCAPLTESSTHRAIDNVEGWSLDAMRSSKVGAEDLCPDCDSAKVEALVEADLAQARVAAETLAAAKRQRQGKRLERDDVMRDKERKRAAEGR